MATIPCDLSIQTYCNLPGSLYPWHAVRRFVHENQGLMKRMYGDIKHISVLRTEINNNDIELDDIEKAASRYSRSGWKKNKYLYSDFPNAKNNDVLTEPYFRPATSTTTKSPSTTTKTTSTQAFPTTAAKTIKSTTSKPERSTKGNAIRLVVPTSTDTQTIYDNITTTTTLVSIPNETGNTIQIVNPPNLTKNKSESATISTTLRIFLPAKISEASITPPQDDETDSDTAGELESTTESFVTKSTNAESTYENTSEISNDYEEEEVVAKVETLDAKQASKNIRPIAATEHMEGQLFQDVVQKETPQPVFNARGV